MSDKPLQGCWLAEFDTRPCSGRSDPAHYIPKQRIKAGLLRRGWSKADIEAVIWDRALWDWACRSHHQSFDEAKTIRLTELQYPLALRQWAAEHGFYYAGWRDGWKAEHDPGNTAA